MRAPLPVGLAVAAAVIGFFLGRFSVESRAPVAEQHAASAEAEEVARLRSKLGKVERELGEISRVDMADYLRLQNEEEKFKKASEILGKLFLVFFGNALLAASPDQEAFAIAAAQGHATGSTTTAATTATESNPAPVGPGESYEPQAGAEHPESGTTPAAPAAAGWAAAEQSLAQVTPANAEAFLKKAEIPDLRQELKTSRAFKKDDPRLTKIAGGMFSGQVKYLDAGRKPRTMELEAIGLEVQDGKLRGAFKARLFEDGKKIGDSNNDGTLSNFWNTGTDSAALIIRNGDNTYYQLYYLEESDALIGNYYEMTTPGDFTLVARMTLTR